MSYLNIYKINEVIIQSQKTQKICIFPYLIKQAVLRGNEGPRTLFEAGEVAGSATYLEKKKKKTE